MVQVRVVGLAVDSRSQPVILLRPLPDEPGAGRVLPIWIGPQEATAIFLAVEGAESPRPLAHDLMKRMLHTLRAQLERVDVTKIEGGTFFAELTVRTEAGERRTIDARPSDAIALAARLDTPIWVADEVLDAAGIAAEVDISEVDSAPEDSAALAEFRRFLDEVDPEDFQG